MSPAKIAMASFPNLRTNRCSPEAEARFRGEAVAMVVGEQTAVENLDLGGFPVTWRERTPIKTVDAALASDAERIHSDRPNNLLTGGRVVRGNVERALAEADVVVEDNYETGFVEHAYIEPEAGFARRVGDSIEVQACTQSPYMDRADIAKILGIPPESVRIIPTAVGGGFGSKLDLSVQPFVALAAWHLNRPARMVYSRHESILCTTKRHPARMRVRAGANRDGKLVALDFSADFNTGAYSSWGPTVAARVPVHASGPYKVPHYRAITRAVHTHLVPAGAFRGFGVPQTAIAQEQVYDDLADRIGMDRLEFRILNALDDDSPTVTGQVLGEGVGIRACLEALRPRWKKARDEAAAFNAHDYGPNSPRRGRRGDVVWLREHFPSQSLHRAGWLEGRRPNCAPSGRGRHRSRLEHNRHPDLCGRNAGSDCAIRSRFRRHRHHARLRQNLGVAANLRNREGCCDGGGKIAARHSRLC